ncbi:DUF302 domain-containing protein [bacterium]|nr:DUF302 domain-containing protein [bacterium]
MDSENLVYGIKRKVSYSFEEAVAKTTACLKSEGFAVLTEINVKQILKEKLDQDFSNYVILGAYNPHLSLDILKANLDTGLLLPCNVVVYESPETGEVFVTVVDPTAMMRITGQEDVIAFSLEIQSILFRALEQL